MKLFFDTLIQNVGTALNQLSPMMVVVLSTLDIVFIGRLLVVLVLCGPIGLERSGHERATGFRPHILVGLGARLMTMAGAYAVVPHIEDHDPLRVASYVISGIGFLGAGAILRHGATVRGVTTAASLWSSAGLSGALGIGMGWLATITAVLILFTLIVLEHVEAHLGRGETANHLDIHLKDDHRTIGRAFMALNRLGAPIKRATVLPAEGETALVRVELILLIKAEQMMRMVRQLLSIEAITCVSIVDLEVEDVEVLRKETIGVDKRAKAQEGHQRLNDENLLRNLSEPAGDSQAVFSVPKDHQ